MPVRFHASWYISLGSDGYWKRAFLKIVTASLYCLFSVISLHFVSIELIFSSFSEMFIPSMQSIETPNRLAMVGRSDRSGYEVPVSHFETAWVETQSISATCPWDKPFFFRLVLNCTENVLSMISLVSSFGNAESILYLLCMDCQSISIYQ